MLNVAGSFWDTVKTRYSPAVQLAGDSACERLTLKDLMAIEAAEEHMLHEALQTSGSASDRAIIRSAKQQSRKNLRALVIASGPGYDANKIGVPIPIGMEEDFAELDRMMAKRDQDSDDEPDDFDAGDQADDFGDEIMET